jgi:hypothetical protein
MMQPTNDHYVQEAMDIARRLLALADEGNAAGRDDCGILLGVLRDCAYKIRREALRQAELQRTDAQIRGPADSAHRGMRREIGT